MQKYLIYAIGEITLVVIGILVALQINNWNEVRKASEVESRYMQNLLIDLSKDQIDLENSVAFGPVPVIFNDSLFTELQKSPLRGREKRIYHFLLLYTNEIEIYYHDRTISQLRNSGGFDLIRNQEVSDAVLDYDVHMRESQRYHENSRTNHLVNSEISHHKRIFEFYRVEHLKDSAIAHADEMDKIAYPKDLKLMSYEDIDIKLALNALSSVRAVDSNKYQRAVQALTMNQALSELIRIEYQLEVP